MKNERFIELINQLHKKYMDSEYRVDEHPIFHVKISIKDRKHALMFGSDDFKILQENNFKNLEFLGLSIDNNFSGAWLSISDNDKFWIEENFVYRKKENVPVETSEGIKYSPIKQRIYLKKE